MNRHSSAALLALLISAPFVKAATQLGNDLSLSGFGTLAGAVTDSNDGQYITGFEAKGATKSPSMLVDSNLGLQVDGQATDWLSGTVQILTTQRTSPRLTARIDWAFVKVVPMEGLSLRAGKFNIPTFLVSDARKIGYANNWLRVPAEVYGLDVLNGGLRGADASYRAQIGNNSLTATAIYGSSSFSQAGAPTIELHRVAGMNLVWDGRWYSLRIGNVQGKPDLSVLPYLAELLPPGISLSAATYRFTGYGFAVDRDNIVLQGEYVQRRLSHLNQVAGANGWYLFGGYRMRQFLPYLEIASTKPTSDATANVAGQNTHAAGVRWDAFASAAVKFQVERVTPTLNNGISFIATAPALGKVTTISAALDFVF